MKVVIIAGLVILIVAFVAVVFVLLRNRNQDFIEDEDFDDNQTPFENHNPNMAGHGQIPQNNNVNVPQQQPQVRNTLEIAQSYIEQQRYDEAENELKTGIRIQPENDDFYLKLLNLYAITSNNQGFQNVFAQIIANGDISAIKQAERLKSMVDAESTGMQSPAVQAAVTQPNIAIEPEVHQGLDFNLGEDNSATSLNTPVNNNIEEPFGNFEDSLLDSNNSNASSAKPSSSTNEGGLDFDLSMGDDDTSLSMEETPTLQETSSTASMPEIDFDMSKNSDMSLDNSFSSETDLLQADLNSMQEAVQETMATNDIEVPEVSNAKVDEDDAGFDFDFDLDVSEKSTTESNEPSFDDLELEIGNQKTSQPALDMDLSSDAVAGVAALAGTAAVAGVAATLSDDIGISAPTALEEKSLEFDSSTNDELDSLEEFSFDTSSLNTSDVTKNTADSISDTTDLSTMGMELDGLNDSPTASTVSPEPVDNDGFSDFSFDVPSEGNEKSPTSTKADITTDVFDSLGDLESDLDSGLNQSDDNFDSLEMSVNTDDLSTDSQNINTGIEAVIETPKFEAPVVEEQPVSAVKPSDTPVPPDVEYSSDFDVLNSLDNHQITLDLASQYLDLGEYDSAKRLLNEVMEMGTSEQQQKAQELLEHAS